MCPSNEKRDVENGRNSTIKQPRTSNLSPKKRIYMDEAISKANFGTFNYILIILSGVILTAVVLETCGISLIIPVSECDLRLTASEKGILSGIAFIGIICSSHLWGFLADTKGRRCLMLPTLFFAFITSVASTLVHNFYILVTLRFLNGFLISAPAATIFAYLSEFHDIKHRSRAIMCSAIIYGVSLILIPLFAWLVINQDWEFDIPYINITYKPWRLFIVACSIPSLIGSIVLMFMPESPKFVLGQGDKAQAYEILCRMNRINNGKQSEYEVFELSEEPDSIANRQRILKCKESRFPMLSSVWNQTAPLFKPPYLFSTVLICTIQFGIFYTSNGVYMFVPEILNKMASNLDSYIDQRMPMCEIINMKPINVTEVKLIEPSEKVCITKLEPALIEQEIVLESLFAVGFILIGLLINKVGKFPILFFLLVVSGSGGYLAMLTDIPVIQTYSFLALICCGMAINIINAATVDLYPTSSRAMAVCISLMFGRLGSVVGANTAASLLDNHCETIFYLSATSLIVISILTFFIPNIHDKNKVTEMMMPNESRLSVISLK